MSFVIHIASLLTVVPEVTVSITSLKPTSLVLTHVAYNFLGLLPARESLATRGRRLHETPLQRQNRVYAPDILPKVEVEDASQRLHASFIDDRHIILAEGECKRMEIRLRNVGKSSVAEIWMVNGTEDELWVDDRKASSSGMLFMTTGPICC